MTITITTTQHATAREWRLPLLDQLTLILYRYRSWEDPLSLRLFAWGARQLFRLARLEEGTLSDEEVAAKVDRLLRTHLCNPMSQAPYERPVLERKWTWERAALEEYAAWSGSNLSPFDGQPMTAPRVHFFACEMLAWAEECLRTCGRTPHPGPTRDLVSTAHTAEARALKLLAYSILAQNAAESQRLWQETRALKTTTAFVQGLRAEMHASIALVAARTRAAGEALEQTLNARIDWIEQRHEEQLSHLQDRLDVLTEQLGEARSRLSSTERQCTEQQTELRELRQRLAQRAQEVAALQEACRDRSDGGGCAVM